MTQMIMSLLRLVNITEQIWLYVRGYRQGEQTIIHWYRISF